MRLRKVGKQFRQRFESLEDRCVLAASALVPGVTLSGSVLNIVTGEGADQVAIADDGAGNVSATINAFDGTVLTGGGSGVTSIRFIGKGDDTVNYVAGAELTSSESLTFALGSGNASLHLDLAAGMSADRLRIAIIGGSGNNAVTADFGAINGTRLGFESFLGSGTDTVDLALAGDLLGGARATFAGQGTGTEDFNMTVNVDIEVDSALAIALTTGRNIDHLNVDFNGLVNGRLDVLVDGGAENDTVGANITVAEGSTGRLNAAVFGGFGDDNETLNIVDNSLVSTGVQAATAVNAKGLNAGLSTSAAVNVETGLTSLRAVIGDVFGTNTLTHTDNVKVLQPPSWFGNLGRLRR